MCYFEMTPPKDIDPRHEKTRSTLRVIGLFAVIIGLAFTAVGMISFFSAFGSFRAPTYFWCAFIGLPVLSIGINILKNAYMERITRYKAGEIAPVAKDTFNYIAEETSEGVKTIADSIKGKDTEEKENYIKCQKCGAKNLFKSKFCQECGERLEKKQICSKCGATHSVNAKFCSICGERL